MKKENDIIEFLKLIISSSKKKAIEGNMTPEQKKEYINKRLFEYFERSSMKVATLFPIYKKVYPEFVKEDFMQYVIEHTSNQDIIFKEKLKVEKKLEKISSRIAGINKQLGIDENLSDFDLMFRKFQQHKSPISTKIDQIKKKYELPTDTIKPKSGQDISVGQMQEYVDLIAEMVDSSSSVEGLYEMAKSQIGFFVGMGDSYEDELRKKSPELFEYIDTLVKGEVGAVMEEKQKLEEEKEELKKLEAGFINMCKKYDRRLPENLRGTAEERKEYQEAEEKRRRKIEREAEERRRQERIASCSDSGGGGCGGGGC